MTKGAFENQKEFLLPCANIVLKNLLFTFLYFLKENTWPLRLSNCNDDANNYCLLCNFAIILFTNYNITSTHSECSLSDNHTCTFHESDWPKQGK